MLWFERQVVGALMRPTLDARGRATVEAYVSDTLRSMPEHLRAGVAAESVVLGAWSWAESRIGRLDERRVRARVDSWKASRIAPLSMMNMGTAKRETESKILATHQS